MIKDLIKSILGRRNIEKIKHYRNAIHIISKTPYKKTDIEEIKLSCLMAVHMIEKAMVMENYKYLNSVNYQKIINNINELLKSGVTENDFVTCGSVEILKSVFKILSGKEKEKKDLENIILKYKIPENLFKGGIEKFSKPDISDNFLQDWKKFVSSRRSVRKFKDKIINRETVYEIIKDAQFCPSACNRQPCKIYFSDNKSTIDKILKNVPDQFVAKDGVHDAFIVTCDRALFYQIELNDQEYVNTGIFLGYLVLSIHAHNLESCLFQFLQFSKKQEQIKKEFGIKESEVIIAFVGFGEPDEESSFACAQRRPIETVAINL